MGQTTGKVDKRKQPHGGALNLGGTPGNRGGMGRPASEIRALFRGDLLATRQAIIDLIGDREPCETCGRKTTDADLIRLGDFFARYGLGAAQGGPDPGLISQLSAAVDQVLSELEGGEAAKQAIYDRWAMTLGRYGAKE